MPTPVVTHFMSGGVPVREELFSPGSGQTGGVVILAYGSDGANRATPGLHRRVRHRLIGAPINAEAT